MGEEPDERVEVRIEPIDDDVGEVAVSVAPSCKLSDVKAALAEQLRRPEVAEQGQFVRMVPNGELMPIHDGQKLGARRALQYRGPELTPAPKPRPPAGLEDFDEFDPEATIDTPRSRLACAAEGVRHQDVIYVPVESFVSAGISPRLARLRHDVTEAYRQDTLAVVRGMRRLLVGEDEGRFAHPTTPGGDSIVGRGGTLSGPLRPHAYPMTHALFEGLRSAPMLDCLYDAPPELDADPTLPLRRPPTSLYEPREETGAAQFASEADLERLDEADQAVSHLAQHFQDMPAGSCERSEGVARKTQSVAVNQRRLNCQKLAGMQDEARHTVRKQVEVAERQTDLANRHHEEQSDLQILRRWCFKDSQAAWTTGLQEANAAAPTKRAEHVDTRRVHIHEQELADESRKNTIRERTVHDELARVRRVAQMKDASTISFSKQWLQRRIHWAANHAEVQRGTEEWRASWVARGGVHGARVSDQKARRRKYNEFVSELRQLRRSVQEMTAERERRRCEHRRRAVKEELELMASTASSMRGPADPMSSTATTVSTKSSKARALPKKAVTRPRRDFPRFDFGRFGADFMSPTASTVESTPASPNPFSPKLSASNSAPGLLGSSQDSSEAIEALGQPFVSSLSELFTTKRS